MIQDGLLPVHKPVGITSFDVVRQVKRRMNWPTVGHCGTLDPFAEGVLLILFGRATKKQSEFLNLPKTYRGLAQFGIRTETGDPEGKVIETAPIPDLSLQALEATLKQFLGDQHQIPPMYSALKFQGRPLYFYARKGQTIDRAARPIHIYAFEGLSCSLPNFEFRLRCSRGTYVRTLVEDVGRKAGSCATLQRLVREAIGSYQLDECLPYDLLGQGTDAEIYSRARAL